MLNEKFVLKLYNVFQLDFLAIFLFLNSKICVYLFYE